MARTAWPTVISGDSWSASQQNTYGRDNDLAYWVYTTAGDLAYATSSSALTRLGIGSAYQILRVNDSATAPGWANPLAMTIVYKSSNQSFSSGSAADVTWNAEVLDDGNWHSNVSNTERITIATTGYYLPFVSIRFVKDSGGSGNFDMTVKVQLNGSDTANKLISEQFVDANPKFCTFGGVPVSATAGQYFSVNFAQDSGGAGNVTGGGSAESSFALIRVR